MVTSFGENVNPTPTETFVVAANNGQVMVKIENRKKKLFRRKTNITPRKVLGNPFFCLLVYRKNSDTRCRMPDAAAHLDESRLPWFIEITSLKTNGHVL